MKLSKCHFFSKEIQYLGHILSTKGIPHYPFEDASHSENASTNHTQTDLCFPWTSRLLQKIYQKDHENSQTFNTTDTPASEI